MSDIFSFEISVAALSCRIGALKKSLTQEQLEKYEQAIKEYKENFIKKHPEMTEAHLKQVEELFK